MPAKENYHIQLFNYSQLKSSNNQVISDSFIFHKLYMKALIAILGKRIFEKTGVSFETDFE